MKLKELKSLLSQVDTFEKPNYKLEQYPTSAELAAHLVFMIQQSFGEIEDGTVADLGCGPGMLTLATLFMGAS